ncbi:MAG: hypothetical protein OXI44_02250 [Bacteroidota bacterium]|nr:hypothetical protein [Bacteroidota bacterium]
MKQNKIENTKRALRGAFKNSEAPLGMGWCVFGVIVLAVIWFAFRPLL